jgi:succinate-semialdehyde dehydrogenase / glutarate-semialdehyde dehydrogenase
MVLCPGIFPFGRYSGFFVPNIVLGNTALLKHASNVPQCAEAIENIVLEAGIPEGVLQNLFIDYKQSEKVIASPYVWGVTLTGSELAGSKVASLAGAHIKKSVLELGGSDPFIVLDDADIDGAVDSGIIARMQNAGQSCIAAKRFIIHQKAYDEFVEKYTQAAQKLVLGDPLDERTFMGPLATSYLVEELESQIAESVKMGAKVLTGGKRSPLGKLYFEPTVLSDITEAMPAFHQEIFGPVACMFKVKDDEEAITLANQTEFGLGGALWSRDENRAFHLAKQIQTGTVAINGGVRSEPRLPFGGTKKSGYGRELADLGLKEFANIKTINIF